jgi:hypothetical protein
VKTAGGTRSITWSCAALLPGTEDWDAVRLPQRLEWLYWPLRPARLLAKYTRKAVRER